ncbi:MAG: hypothetical protein WC797_04060, partial [Candidatus Paceibacterota bacterium]
MPETRMQDSGENRWPLTPANFDNPSRRETIPKKDNLVSQIKNEIIDAFNREGAGLDVDARSRINEVKKKCIERFPDQIKEIELLFGIVDMASNMDLIVETQGSSGQEARRQPGYRPDQQVLQQRKEAFEELAEYNYMLTDTALRLSDNPEAISNFWKELEDLTKIIPGDERINLNRLWSIKSGVLSQVAIFKGLEKQGLAPKLSVPKEDAFNSVDIWLDKQTALQIKTSRSINYPQIFNLDDLFSEQSVIGQGLEKQLRAIERSKAGIERLRKISRKNINGYIVLLPTKEFDPTTGTPSETLSMMLETFAPSLPQQPSQEDPAKQLVEKKK